MDKTWLVLDVSYLAYRGFHTLGLLQYAGSRTGVVFSVLRDVRYLMDEFGTHDIVFAFDAGCQRRKELDPIYKAARHNRTRPVEELQALEDVRRQIRDLRDSHLPDLGYRNVFWQDGYEADDVIASVCHTLPPNHTAVVVSADQDLYQLLSGQVSMYNPHKKEVMTSRLFREKFLDLPPGRWPEVKAIAGCKSDGVPGCKGVGEVIASKYLTTGATHTGIGGGRGKDRKVPVKQASKTFAAVQDWLKSDRYVTNLQLTTLPFPGYTPRALHSDPLDNQKWRRKCEELGIRSIKTLRSGRAFFGRTHAQA